MEENTKSILNLLLTKAALKQDISDRGKKTFNEFREEARKEIDELKKKVTDPRIRLYIDEKSNYEFHTYIGSDVLVFQMHTNVFKLPDDHPMWKTPYLEKNEANGYFGLIHIYNFLAESFIKNRANDAGYLIGRMFVNNEGHFIVEGKGQLGLLFKDLEIGMLNVETLRHIVQVSFAYAIDFDLFTPPYELVHELSVGQVQALGNMLHLSTGKRLGFKYKAED